MKTNDRPSAEDAPVADADWKVDDNGLLYPARQSLSPNRDARPEGVEPALIVLHGISLPPGEFGGAGIEDLFCNRLDWNAHPYYQTIEGMQVSAHLLVRRTGEVIQFVPFGERAWHAGLSSFRGVERCNDYSIGIEMEGEDERPYDPAQYPVVAAIIQALCRRYPALEYRAIAAHSDIAPGRKTDPGPAFDWLQLYDYLGRHPTRDS